MDDFSADFDTTGVLLTDGSVSAGTVETLGDDDWFVLTVAEAQTIQINLTSVSLSDPFLYVYDSSGTLVTANDDFGSLDSQLTFNFEVDTYYISARAYNDLFTGTYQLTATTVEDDFATGFDTTGVLTTDGTPVAGVLNFNLDIDTFAIAVTEGQLYQISFASNEIVNPHLVDAAGNFLGSEDLVTGLLIFEAEATETYYVSTFASQQGSYELTAVEIQDDFSENINTTERHWLA